jgi:hypothetical protein
LKIGRSFKIIHHDGWVERQTENKSLNRMHDFLSTFFCLEG